MELRERVARAIDDLRAVIAMKLISLALSMHPQTCFDFSADTMASVLKADRDAKIRRAHFPSALAEDDGEVLDLDTKHDRMLP